MTAKKTEKNIEWQTVQDRIAVESGLAVILTDERSPALAKSNNNSICENLYNSERFAPECDKYCGKAFKLASEAEKVVGYKCYAGLNCLAVPIAAEEKQFVVITGRTFLKAEDYRNATERAISGDWQQFQANEFFENVLLSSSNGELEWLSKKIENLSGAEKQILARFEKSDDAASGGETKQESKIAENAETHSEQAKPDDWRVFLDSLTNFAYKEACVSVLEFLETRYGASNTVWLERRDERLQAAFARGSFERHPIQIGLEADDERLIEAARRETSLLLRERREEITTDAAQIIRLFPILMGGKIQAGLIAADSLASENVAAGIARFCRSATAELEIIKLREELSRRSVLASAVRRFNDAVKNVDAENFWDKLMQISADLVKSERSSLLVFNEKTESLAAKAATGASAEIIKTENEHLGERVALRVLHEGEPLIVKTASETKLSSAPSERSYKTDSFISYPIIIGERRIGVLNVTDKAGGGRYDEADLEILSAIVPQIAVIIDRAGLKHKAGEFEQLSVTDSLTGLLNRRYLEERLAEEIKRSNRHGFPMSFLMLDVDDFKSYNDNFSHPEGDRALQIVGQTLKETLRGADVAARYGGEEFSILLPQTTLEEAAAIAERIRERIENTEFPKRKVTVSIGIADCSQTNCTPRKLISAADAALYEAKRKGRNNVQLARHLEKDASTK